MPVTNGLISSSLWCIYCKMLRQLFRVESNAEELIHHKSYNSIVVHWDDIAIIRSDQKGRYEIVVTIYN